MSAARAYLLLGVMTAILLAFTLFVSAIAPRPAPPTPYAAPEAAQPTLTASAPAITLSTGVTFAASC